MTLSMVLSAQQQHYPRKGTCTRHGNRRPIIPVTSCRKRKSGDEKPCGSILTCDLACAAKAPLCSLTDPALVVGLVQRSAGGIRSSTGIQSCVVGEDAINGVLTRYTTQHSCFRGCTVVHDYCLPDRRVTAGGLSKICCCSSLLCLLAGRELWPWICPSDRLLRTCMRGWKV